MFVLIKKAFPVISWICFIDSMKSVTKLFFLILIFSCSAGVVYPGEPEAIMNATVNGNKLSIRIVIPPQHHAYLDKGKEGNYIPVSFNWAALIKDGSLKKEPTMISAPKGEFEKVASAKVLRGEGIFIFESVEIPSLKGKSIKVKSQICDDIKGVCYRPSIKDVKIQ